MKREREQLMPEARSEGLVVQELSGEMLVYDRRRHKAHCLNQTAALVWKHCDGKTTVEQTARALERESKAPVSEDVVWLGVEQLSKTHLLRDGAPRHKSGLTRREVLRRAGLAAVIALPVVTSIVAPKAVDAVTCKGAGAACTASAECCSGLCSGNMCT